MPRAVWIPVQRAEARERGHEVHVVIRVERRGERLRLRRVADHAEAVAKPLPPRTGHEDRRLERVIDLVGQAPGDRRQQSLLGGRRLAAGVQEGTKLPVPYVFLP